MTAQATAPIKVDPDWIDKLLNQHDKNKEQKVPLHALAPMVDQSDLPFRLLCRQFGCKLCFTPMIHAKLYTTDENYRKKFTLKDTPDADRPLIAQICGGDAETVLKACLLLQDYCDGIDINCGCPQGIAKRGHYGAFLLEQEEELLTLVRTLHEHLTVPLSVKVRLLPGPRDKAVEDSIALYRKLIKAGVHLLSIHGRNRLNKGPTTGAADWKAIATVIKRLREDTSLPRIPIFANGSIATLQDVCDCLEETKADGVMSAEAVLENPSNLFLHGSRRVGRLELSRQYLEMARQYPPELGGQGGGMKCIRSHLHRFLFADLQVHHEIRSQVVGADTIEDLDKALNDLTEIHQRMGHDPQQEQLSWYMRHRIDAQTGQNVSEERRKNEGTIVSVELADDAAECFDCLFNSQ
jgi:tRNA-dihydrouridine synthase 1